MIPALGTNNQWSSLAVFLKDSLGGMGDFLTQDVGSLNWIESMVMAQMAETGFGFLQLMSEQIQPASSSVFLDRWAQVYNLQGLSSVSSITAQLKLIQSLTGTPPTFSNVQSFLQNVLGPCYLGIQWAPENQGFATIDPYTQLIINKSSYQMPLSEFIVYIWQPRDNKDNLLMSNAQFAQLLQTYPLILETWLPHFSDIETMNLTNRGNQDGYGGGYNGLNFNNYLDGYNVVTGTAGGTTLVGTNTTFTADFFPINGHNYLHPGTGLPPQYIDRTPPIQIVDDTNVVQTYYVKHVSSDTSITLTSPLLNNITLRTYRTLGIVMDTDGFLDGSMFSE